MKPTWIVVDVEASGPCPGKGSITEIGAVSVETPEERFYARMRPLDPTWPSDPEALAVTQTSYLETLSWADPRECFEEFRDWLATVVKYGQRPVFVSDNPAWDFQWINYYFWHLLGKNPFGHSGRRIGDLWAGLVRNANQPWKQLRETKHTHNPVDDALGNVEALHKILTMMGQGA